MYVTWQTCSSYHRNVGYPSDIGDGMWLLIVVPRLFQELVVHVELDLHIMHSKGVW